MNDIKCNKTTTTKISFDVHVYFLQMVSKYNRQCEKLCQRTRTCRHADNTCRGTTEETADRGIIVPRDTQIISLPHHRREEEISQGC